MITCIECEKEFKGIKKETAGLFLLLFGCFSLVIFEFDAASLIYGTMCIGVGLYSDYGPAQKLYFQLGFIPDGNGITYRGQPTIPGQSYPLDDDLLLWLVKLLNG